MRLGRTANKKLQMEEKIFDSAMKLFEKQGIANTTLQDICIEAGVSKGTIFNYFSSKEDILARFGRNQLKLLNNYVDELPSTFTTMEKVIAVLLKDFRTVKESEFYTRITLQGISEGGEIIHKLENKNRRELAEIYERILKQGQKVHDESFNMNISLVSDLIVTIYFHSLDKHFFQNESVEDTEQFIQQSIHMLFNGISNYVGD